MSIRSSVNQFLFYPIGVYRLYKRMLATPRVDNGKRRIYLLNVPSHGNLGDHLLSVAEKKFFADHFSQFELVLVSSSDLYYSIRIALRNVKSDDILCITGGGFLGSLYQEEGRFFKILGMFPDNKVVVLPQTIYYENTVRGQKMLQRATKLYARHKHLYVVARDRRSYDLLNTVLMKDRKDRVAYTPDIALYLKFSGQYDRKGILWCLRTDDEKNSINEVIIQQLQSELSVLRVSQKHTDTYVNYSIPIEREDVEVSNKIQEISRARVVITDRLHGMIYAVITSTPVIAMDNVNGKVRQVYEQWIKHVPYIRFIDDPTKCKGALEDMMSISSTDYPQDELLAKYQPIIDFINDEA